MGCADPTVEEQKDVAYPSLGEALDVWLERLVRSARRLIQNEASPEVQAEESGVTLRMCFRHAEPHEDPSPGREEVSLAGIDACSSVRKSRSTFVVLFLFFILLLEAGPDEHVAIGSIAQIVGGRRCVLLRLDAGAEVHRVLRRRVEVQEMKPFIW